MMMTSEMELDNLRGIPADWRAMLRDIESMLEQHKPELADEWRAIDRDKSPRYVGKWLQERFPRPDGWGTMDINIVASELQKQIGGQQDAGR